MSKTIISDVHGCFKTLMALIDKLKNQGVKIQDLVFVGDLIDRGPDSKKVVEYVKSNNIPCVRGNHEDLLIEAIEDNELSSFLHNGGQNTLDNYTNDTDFSEHLEYLKSLPTYLIFDEVYNNKKLLVTHAISVDIIDEYLDINSRNIDLEMKSLSLDKLEDSMLWNRGIPNKYSSSYFNISGHNILSYYIYDNHNNLKVKESNLIDGILLDKENGYACIDTGAFVNDISNKKYEGKMTAISFPEMIVTQQQNIEEKPWN